MESDGYQTWHLLIRNACPLREDSQVAAVTYSMKYVSAVMQSSLLIGCSAISPPSVVSLSI